MKRIFAIFAGLIFAFNFAFASDEISAMKILPKNLHAQFSQIVDIYGGAQKFKNLKIEIYENQNLPRALAGANILKIRRDVFEMENFAQIVAHELAHTLDLGFYRGSAAAGKSKFRDGALPIFKNDASLKFYEISWADEKTQLHGTSAADFVSGYARTDAFEDFAESATFYIFAGRQFQNLARENVALQKKFEFLRDEIFGGFVFQTGEITENSTERIYDATQLRL